MPYSFEVISSFSLDPKETLAGLVMAFGAGAGLAVGLTVLTGASRRARGVISTVFCFVPVAGAVVRYSDLGHAALVLQNLIQAGVPLTEALDGAAELDLLPRHAALFRRLRKRVEEGESLGDALKADSARLPRTFRTMVSLGEHSARLPEALGQLARLYREKARRKIRFLIGSVYPLFVMGGGMPCVDPRLGRISVPAGHGGYVGECCMNVLVLQKEEMCRAPGKLECEGKC